MSFNPNSNLLNPSISLLTISKYSDALLHQLRVVFDNRQLRITVDGIDKQSGEGITIVIFLLLSLAIVFIVGTITFSQPSLIWFGAIPSNLTLSSELPDRSFQGCLYNPAYSNTGQLSLFNTAEAYNSRLVYNLN